MADMNKVAYTAIINNAHKSETGRMNAVIPVSMIEVDPLYQRVEGRNVKKLRKLRNEWDYNLMDALLVVPHPETHDFYVVDGLGRLTVAREKGLESVDCVIIPGPADPEERRVFEASIFVRQSVCTNPLRPVDMHNALVINGDEIAKAVEDLCKEYSVEIRKGNGKRRLHELGSYSTATNIVKVFGRDVLEFVFEVIAYSGFSEEANGYADNLMTALAKFRVAYPFVTKKELATWLKPMSFRTFKARAIASYPERCSKIAMVLFMQDWAVERGNTRVFDDKGKLVAFQKKAAN